MIVALDLLSGISQGLAASFETLAASGQPSLMQLLPFCAEVCPSISVKCSIVPFPIDSSTFILNF